MKLIDLRQIGQRALQLLLLVSLLMPAFVPSGYMVKRNETTDVVELTVCPGVAHHQSQLAVGATRFDLDASSSGIDTNNREGEAAPCPLAISTLASMPDISMPGVLVVQAVASLDTAVQDAYQTFLVLPPVRAPPFLS